MTVVERVARLMCELNFAKKGGEGAFGTVDDCWWAFADEARALLSTPTAQSEPSEAMIEARNAFWMRVIDEGREAGPDEAFEAGWTAALATRPEHSRSCTVANCFICERDAVIDNLPATTPTPTGDGVERFFIDHGMIHDRVTGKHVSTSPIEYDDGKWDDTPVRDACALLNALTRPDIVEALRVISEEAKRPGVRLWHLKRCVEVTTRTALKALDPGHE